MKPFGVLTFFLAASCANAGEPPRACAPPDYFVLGGIGLGDDSASLKKFGQPKATEPYESEDDGGQYTGKRLHFLHLQVDFNQLRGVERVATGDPAVPLPAGIRIGMSLAQVEERLHFIAGNLDESNVVTLPACNQQDEENELQLQFNDISSVRVLNQVAIEQYGP